MSETPSPAPSITDFEPVPRSQQRHDGWTAERQRDFIAGLAQSGSVTAAARMVGMSVESAYRLRHAAGADGFAAAWSDALDRGIARLEDIAVERAIGGVETPVWHHGEQVGTRIVYNDRLLMFLLRARRAERYGDTRRGDIPEGSDAWKRLRAKWVAEQAVQMQQAADRMTQRLELMRGRHRRRRAERATSAIDAAGRVRHAWERAVERTAAALGAPADGDQAIAHDDGIAPGLPGGPPHPGGP